MVPDSLLNSESDGSVRLHIDTDLLRIALNDYVEVRDTTVIKDLAIPLTVTVSPGLEFINNVEDFVYEGIDVALDRIVVSTGSIEYQIGNPLSETVLVTYSIPSATLQGVPLSIEDTIPAGSPSSPFIRSGVFDLSGYDIDLTGVSGTESNTLQTQYAVKTLPTGNSITVSPSDIIETQITFKDLTPYYVKGYFGQQAIIESSPGDTLNGIPDLNGNFDLTDANVSIKLTNEFGADGKARFDQIRTINSSSGNFVDLMHPEIGTDINISRAIQSVNGVDPFEYELNLTGQNSNILDLLEVLPDRIGYNLSFELNPLGNVSGGNDFAFGDSEIAVALMAEIPLQFSSSGIQLSDTLNFSIDSLTTDMLSFAELQLTLNNTFPFDLSVELFTMDGQSNYTIGSSTSIQSAITQNGYVVSPSTSTVTYTLTEEDLLRLQENGKLIMIASLQTDGGSQVTIYENYTISFTGILSFQPIFSVD